MFTGLGFIATLGNLPTLGLRSGLFGNVELKNLTDESGNYLVDENLKQLVSES